MIKFRHLDLGYCLVGLGLVLTSHVRVVVFDVDLPSKELYMEAHQRGAVGNMHSNN